MGVATDVETLHAVQYLYVANLVSDERIMTLLVIMVVTCRA